MAELTFRDFAGAVMRGDVAAGGTVLETLLGLPADGARAASEHFKSRMGGDPAFMQKAMGLRNAITTGTADDIAVLLTDCFGLDAAQCATATATLQRAYQPPS